MIERLVDWEKLLEAERMVERKTLLEVEQAEETGTWGEVVVETEELEIFGENEKKLETVVETGEREETA